MQVNREPAARGAAAGEGGGGKKEESWLRQASKQAGKRDIERGSPSVIVPLGGQRRTRLGSSSQAEEATLAPARRGSVTRVRLLLLSSGSALYGAGVGFVKLPRLRPTRKGTAR